MGKQKTFAFLDEHILTKPALPAEAIWDREQNSEDKLDIVFKEKAYLTELTYDSAVFHMQGTSKAGSQGTTLDIDYRTAGKKKKKQAAQALNLSFTDTTTGLESENDEFDRTLMQNSQYVRTFH